MATTNANQNPAARLAEAKRELRESQVTLGPGDIPVNPPALNLEQMQLRGSLLREIDALEAVLAGGAVTVPAPGIG
jgi:hypothetical protein